MGQTFSAKETRVVASLAPETNHEAVALARLVPANVPTVEIRLDALREAPDFEALRAGFEGRSLIGTLRSRREGGAFDGVSSGTAISELLSKALGAGFDFVDVEFHGSGGDTLLGLSPARVILSVHDTAGLPPDLAELPRAMRRTGARFLKIVGTPRDSREALELLRIQKLAFESSRGDAGPGLTVFGMGEAGLMTRVLSPYFGAALSYGALVAGRETAAGQIPASDLVDIYGVSRRAGVARLYALFGGFVSHSFSPALHNPNFEAHHEDALYVPIALRSLLREFDPLVAAFDGWGLPLRGASVTIPFKEEAATVAVYRGESVANTLVRSGDSFIASNTDRVALASFLPLAFPGRRALVLGAGGTARVAIEVLISRRYEVFVWSRDPVRAHEIAEETTATFLPRLPADEPPFAVLVNATPLGMRAGDPLPCPEGFLHPELTVIDAPYRPGGTALAAAASERGARVVDGFTFLLEQAARQAEIFTGRESSSARLLSRLPKRVRERMFPDEAAPSKGADT